jgi:septation ring formation regulator EzrA
MKSTVVPTQLSPVSQPENPMSGLQQQDDFGQSSQQQDYEYQYPAQENATTEELVESIIEEKWGDLLKDVNKIIDWKNRTETRITSLEQKFNDLKESFDQLHRAVVGKVSEYDKHILEVGSEIKAMEKVFQKVLPSFTDNVNELSRIVDKVKKNPAK